MAHKNGVKGSKQHNRYLVTERVNLRNTHRGLWRTYMVFAIGGVGLGLNFIFTKPTFNPYDVPKEWVGLIFLVMGLLIFIFLNLYRSLRLIRASIATIAGFMVFWGVGASFTFFQGKTSLQNFIVYMMLSALGYVWLVEPFVNPITANGKEKDK